MYAYQLQPPQPDTRLHKIKAILGKARTAARRAARLWGGRIVVETRVSHILIVSDTPSRRNSAARAIEAELKRLKVEFAVNEPIALPSPKPARRLPRRRSLR